MASAARVFRNLYRDSVSLMQLSAKLGALAGVRQASAIMATAGNLDLLREAGLAPAEVEAGPNDLLVALEGEEEALEAALAAAEAELTRAPAAAQDGGPRRMPPRSLEMALGEQPTANLALISTPGDYAAAEAMKALRLGLNVMLFSDNVALEDEIALKRYAREHDLLVMGPDCGTAIIGGVPLGFANVVRRGEIGVDRRVRHRPAAGDLPDRPLGQRHLAGDRHRRPRPAREGRRHHHAPGAARACRRSRDPRHRADLQAAPSRGGQAGARCRRRGPASRSWRTFSAPTPRPCGARTSTRCGRSRMRRGSPWPWSTAMRHGRGSRSSASRRSFAAGAGAEVRPRPLQRRHLLLRGPAAAYRGARPDRLEHAARARADARRRRGGASGTR